MLEFTGGIAGLVRRWRSEADLFRRRGQPQLGELVESMAGELEEAMEGGALGAEVPPAPPPVELLTADAAASRLGVSTSWVYHNAKTLPFTRRVGTRVRFDPVGMDKWLRDQHRRAA